MKAVQVWAISVSVLLTVVPGVASAIAYVQYRLDGNAGNYLASSGVSSWFPDPSTGAQLEACGPNANVGGTVALPTGPAFFETGDTAWINFYGNYIEFAGRSGSVSTSLWTHDANDNWCECDTESQDTNGIFSEILNYDGADGGCDDGFGGGGSCPGPLPNSTWFLTANVMLSGNNAAGVCVAAEVYGWRAVAYTVP